MRGKKGEALGRYTATARCLRSSFSILPSFSPLSFLTSSVIRGRYLVVGNKAVAGKGGGEARIFFTASMWVVYVDVFRRLWGTTPKSPVKGDVVEVDN